ncbi:MULTISPECIES: molybdopterin-synthase adenylyltransferase MoeB [unclassified Bradyrhizobium]|uniref:molybdopterin-synthase adenylyltransferase MoeB n=1 Tax=unclassified Bradyrhizobium TaxID=2631580 RepID=UPI0029168690|nr:MULTISPECIES: molybdopterin-synthase adenylyltransferase MoeB [unclassified Bradyrhizobium]
MITVRIPKPLADVAGVETLEHELDASTLAEALKGLTLRYPHLEPHCFNKRGEINDILQMYLNGTRTENRLAPLREGDWVEILIAASGGAGYEAVQEALSAGEVRRYARHLTLPGLGRAGQLRLKSARVLIIGAGGLGSPIALYLAAAGVGKIGIVDFDVVEESNLQRQIIHDLTWVGRPKVDSARDRIRKLNPDIEVEAIKDALDEHTGPTLIANYDVIIDGTDNFNARGIVNRVSRSLGKPLVFGSVYQFEGQVSVFNTSSDAPCFQCLFPKLPDGDLAPNCAAGGVIGVVPGLVGLFQAMEALKLILGIGDPLVGRVLTIDTLTGAVRELRFNRPTGCPTCGTANLVTRDTPAASEMVQAPSQPISPEKTITPQDLAELLVSASRPLLLDVREPGELEICQLEGAMNIPVARLAANLRRLDRSSNYVVFCRSGVRSARALRLMLDADFRNVRHLDGGLLRWAKEIDRSMTIV